MKLKNIVISILALLFSATTAYAADTLYEYYSGDLPTIEQRAEVAAESGILDYVGSYEQNINLLSYLQSNQEFGISIPTVVALFETSLQAKVSSDATTMTLVKGTDKAGTTLSGSYGLIIDEGTSSEEFVICTASGTALTACIRGIDVQDGKTEVVSLQKSHRRGATVKATNFPQLAILSRILNGDEYIPNIIAYEPDLSFVGASTTAIVSKTYVDSLVNQGAATSTELLAGIAELATRKENASSTPWGATEPHVQQSQHSTSTPSANIGTTGDGLWDIWTENDGKMNQDFLDLTEGFALASTSATSLNVLGNATTTGNQIISGNATTTGSLHYTELCDSNNNCQTSASMLQASGTLDAQTCNPGKSSFTQTEVVWDIGFQPDEVRLSGLATCTGDTDVDYEGVLTFLRATSTPSGLLFLDGGAIQDTLSGSIRCSWTGGSASTTIENFTSTGFSVYSGCNEGATYEGSSVFGGRFQAIKY